MIHSVGFLEKISKWPQIKLNTTLEVASNQIRNNVEMGTTMTNSLLR